MGTKIGDVSITPIIEIDYPVPASFLLPDATPENLAPDLDWLEPHFVTPRGERLKMIIQAFLVESRGLSAPCLPGTNSTAPSCRRSATPGSRANRSTWSSAPTCTSTTWAGTR